MHDYNPHYNDGGERDDRFEEGFKTGIAVTVVGGLAIYGAIQLVKNIRKSPRQKLLESLGEDLEQIEYDEEDYDDDDEEEDYDDD
ncbi:MAG: hypothetical protein HRF51_00230 [bacterium]|jgi:hypothetical protein